VHVLDDPSSLSPRAQAFLKRTGHRSPEDPARLSTDYLQILDTSGRRVPAPTELVIRREGFAARFGGLRYEVRRSVLLAGERYDMSRRWDFELNGWVRREFRGWSFGWLGERVSSPVRYLVHTDGRFGVMLDGPFLEVSPSIDHMIESHALMDEMASWNPVAGGALETWVPSSVNELPDNATDDLRVVPEASGPCERWLSSDTTTIRLFSRWTSDQPRPAGVMIWTRDGMG
jgi:hypothetical protein